MSLLESSDPGDTASHENCVAYQSLQSLETLLKQTLLTDSRQVLRLWLISEAAKLKSVHPAKVWQRISSLLPAGGQPKELVKPFCLQLLQLICEVEPEKVVRVLQLHSNVLVHYFTDRPAHITAWFPSSYSANVSDFKHGVKALAQYALNHRAEMWDLLVWRGKHPQAPVTVAAKPHYFSELDMKKTIKNLLKYHPEFFASDQMLKSLESGDITALDRPYFCQELYRLLANDDRDVTDMVKSTLQHQPFELVCHRLLHHADDEYLFYFTCGILSRSQSLDSFQLLHKQHILQSATSEQAVMQVKLQLDAMLSLMLYGLIKFKDLDSMLIAVAAAFHIQDVIKLLEEAGKLQDALQTTRHISFLQSGKQVMRLLKVSAQGVHTDFHHALILTLAAQHLQLDQAMACGESTLISFLSDSGVTAKKRQTVQHELLRPVRKKRRKSEKQQHKKRRKSKHDRAEQADSDDSLNDVDLGIMSSDTDLKSGSDVWQLDIPDCSGIPVPLENLPHVFLYHSLLRWLAAKA